MKSIILVLFLVTTSYSFGQQLVYKPINPAFGGETFNYQWLLNSANAQNGHEDDSIDPLSALGDFDLNNFSNPAGQLDNQIPGVGTSADGNLQYEVFDSSQGLVINILDILTGEQSQIIIPNN